jgi:hypothetical protein
LFPAGVNGAEPLVVKRKSTLEPLVVKRKSTFDWRACVEAFTQKHLEPLADWRGYSVEFCQWLKENSLVGLYDCYIAFPVHDDAGKVVAAHHRLKDGKWNYKPLVNQEVPGVIYRREDGTLAVKSRPLVIGELHPGDTVHIFESQWDAFAFAYVSGIRDGIIIARGAGNGALVADLIPQGATVYVWPQNDAPGQKWAKDVCAHAEKSCTIKLAKSPVQYGDLNDWTRAGATTDDLLNAIVKAETLREPERIISWRSPDEILSMPRNRKANFLGDRLLGVARSLVLAGVGGIGKSRLLLQLLVALILERVWCGIETHHNKGKPWMLVQTQNSVDRLQDDLEPLKKYAGRDWPLVEKNLLIHTLETDRDLMLHLSDPKNARDLESAIRERNPIGVAFDPLNEIGIGDLSKDVDMQATCCEIGRISRAGNPERAIVIAAHAITGLAGMKKAWGFEAAGFGRGSKVLQFWTRAQINAIPATEDHSILGLICGKNNDGKMFSPFAVRLNPDTMIYEPNPDFDMEAFQEHLTTTEKKKKPKFNVEMVKELVKFSGELDMAGLAKLIQKKTGCGKSRSYELVHEGRKAKIFRFHRNTELYALD